MFAARHARNTLGVFPRNAARRFAADYLRRAADCREAQRTTLTKLVGLNAETSFGSSVRLDALRNPSDLRRLPVTTYEDYRPLVAAEARGERGTLLGPENPPLMFARSSGTTGEPKLIPVTRAFLDDYRRGWRVWGIGAIDDHPGISLGTILQLTSDHESSRTEAGIPVGQISGLVAAMQGPVIRSMMTLPRWLAKVADPDEKLRLTLRLAAADRHVRLIATANPGTLTRLAKVLAADGEALIKSLVDGETLADGRRLTSNRRRGRGLARILNERGVLTPHNLWPRLSLLGVWTGGCAALYGPLLERDFAPPAVRDHGLHASEGRMTIPLTSGTPSGLLDVHSHVFEFIPVGEHDAAEPVVLGPEELDVGGEYFILLTTASGFVRYDIGDVVRCTGFRGTTPLLEFRHKGAHVSSVTGEKLTESQVAEAAVALARDLGLPSRPFVVLPEWGEPPRYVLAVEGADRVEAATRAAAMEKSLTATNVEYAEKRSTGRLAPLRAEPLPPGTIDRVTTSRFGEQAKEVALRPDFETLGRVRIAAADRESISI